jgi:hypothetical protein
VGLDDIASIWSDLVSKLSLSFFFAVLFLSKTRLCHLRLFIIFFISCSVLFLRLKIYNVSHVPKNFCEKNSRDIDISVPSIISCFIFWNSLRTSLIISALKASISCAVSETPSLTPFTLRRVSSEAEPNLLRTDFGDSAPLENLLFDVLFLSQDFLSGELSGSYKESSIILLISFSSGLE